MEWNWEHRFSSVEGLKYYIHLYTVTVLQFTKTLQLHCLNPIKAILSWMRDVLSDSLPTEGAERRALQRFHRRQQEEREPSPACFTPSNFSQSGWRGREHCFILVCVLHCEGHIVHVCVCVCADYIAKDSGAVHYLWCWNSDNSPAAHRVTVYVHWF